MGESKRFGVKRGGKGKRKEAFYNITNKEIINDL